MSKRTLIFGTWNVQGISNKLTEVVSEIEKNQIDIAVVTETKKKGHGSENLGCYDMFYSGVSKDQRAQQGVAILVRKGLRKSITSWEAVSPRIIKINLTLHSHKVTLIGVYGVNDDAQIAVKDQFFEQLNDEVLQVGTTREVIVIGDLNGRVGNRRDCKIVGPFGENVVNDNGNRLIEVCEQHELKILNGFYQHRDIHKYTWVQQTRGLKSIIDYAITKQASRLKVQQVKVCRGLSCGSDHHFLKVEIAFPVKIGQPDVQQQQHQQQGEAVRPVRYNIDSLQHQSVRGLYGKRLDEKLSERADFKDAEDQYEFIKACIHTAAEEALGVCEENKVESKPYWWDQEIEEEINAKRRRYHSFLSSKSDEDKVAYKHAQARVRRLIVKKKNEAWEKNCSRINTYLGGRKSAESWKLIKGLRRDMKRDILSPITISQLEDHFKELLTEGRPEFQQRSAEVSEEEPDLDVSLDEVVRAIRELKNGKAPGPGSIPSELIKCGTRKLFGCITELMKRCIKGEEVPKEWKESWISAIHKKGKKDDCENYRGLSVTGTMSKIYGKILKAKIEEEWAPQEAEEQAGFRAGRSTVDHLFCLTQLIEKRMTVGQELHLVFVDLKKAYDSVPLMKLWEALEKSNFSNGLVTAIKQFYQGSFARIKCQGKLSAGFYVSKGLKQGCCLSPTLFKIYLEHVLKEWKRKCSGMGVPLNDRDTLFTLCFADDQVVIAQDADDAEYMTRKLVAEYRKWGLEVSISKTEKLTIGGDQQDIELDDGQRIRSCERYKYLGVWVSQDGRLDHAIKDRNLQGRRAIAMLNGVLWDQRISKDNKKLIYTTIVKSILSYGSEVWQMKSRTQDILKATEMDFWRRSAGISRRDHVRNERVREIMDAKETIVHEIMTKQLVWYGHVQRMADDRLPKKILEYVPPGRRRRGRPAKSWISGIQDEMRRCQLPEDLWGDRWEWRLGVAERPRAL